MSVTAGGHQAFWVSAPALDQAVRRVIQAENDMFGDAPAPTLVRRAICSWLQERVEVLLEDLDPYSPRCLGWQLALDRVMRTQEVAR